MEAASELLHDGGFRDLTQPKVAAKAGMTQSHLTYYFPTRSNMLEAIADLVVDRQLERWDTAGTPDSPHALVERIVTVTSSARNTRALISLILAVDPEPPVRAAMVRLVHGLRERVARALALCSGEDPKNAEHHLSDARLMHSTWAGMALVGLVEGDQYANPEANRQAITRLVTLLLPSEPPSPSPKIDLADPPPIPETS